MKNLQKLPRSVFPISLMGVSYVNSVNLNSKIHAIFSGNIESRWFLPMTFLSCVIFLVLRKPIFVLTQPGRVEDVDVLLREAIQYSWSSIFVVYNYYLHVIPRLVTIFSLHLFGITNVNLAMNLIAIIIATLCAVFFSSRQFRFIIKNDLLRSACSLFVIAAPGINEIYSNISSIQWFLNIFIMLFVALLFFRYEEYKKQSARKKSLYAFFCSAAFLSSAFSIVFLPALIYVIIRELRKDSREIITATSCIIPTILLSLQAVLLYQNYLQQFKLPLGQANIDVIKSTMDVFSVSIIKIFYNNIYQNSGLFYLIPIVVVAFILLVSIRKGLRFEIFTLYCIVATLFLSVIVRGGMAERFTSFAIIFSFILIVRQFDRLDYLPFKLVFLAVLIIVVSNVAEGFFIPTFADENWKYVTSVYVPSGPYQCYIGEVPHGWSLFVPCEKPISNSTVSNASSTTLGPSITFTPPIVTTITQILSDSTIDIYGMMTKLTAIVYPIPDGGTIQFHVDDKTGEPITVVGGQATFSAMLPIGIHHIFASYSGAPNFYASKSSQTDITILSHSNLQGVNLTGVNIQGIDLSGVNLSGVNLSGADMQNTNFSSANLHNANLSGATLLGANLSGADLSDANLNGDILSGVNLSDANLSNANLKDANIKGANFAGAITKDCNGCP